MIPNGKNKPLRVWYSVVVGVLYVHESNRCSKNPPQGTKVFVFRPRGRGLGRDFFLPIGNAPHRTTGTGRVDSAAKIVSDCARRAQPVKGIAVSPIQITVVVSGSGNAAGIYALGRVRGQIADKPCATRRINSAPFHSAVLPLHEGEPLGNPHTIPFRENSKRKQMFDVERMNDNSRRAYPPCG